jgi:hypothetical protein
MNMPIRFMGHVGGVVVNGEEHHVKKKFFE